MLYTASPQSNTPHSARSLSLTWNDEARDGLKFLLCPDLDHTDAFNSVEQRHVLAEGALEGEHADSDGCGHR